MKPARVQMLKCFVVLFLAALMMAISHRDAGVPGAVGRPPPVSELAGCTTRIKSDGLAGGQAVLHKLPLRARGGGVRAPWVEPAVGRGAIIVLPGPPAACGELREGSGVRVALAWAVRPRSATPEHSNRPCIALG